MHLNEVSVSSLGSIHYSALSYPVGCEDDIIINIIWISASPPKAARVEVYVGYLFKLEYLSAFLSLAIG